MTTENKTIAADRTADVAECELCGQWSTIESDDATGFVCDDCGGFDGAEFFERADRFREAGE